MNRFYFNRHPKHRHSKLYIMDARGRVAATLNMAAGKGTEDVSEMQNTELVFGNIDNIHVMRQAASSLAEGDYNVNLSKKTCISHKLWVRIGEQLSPVYWYARVD